VKILVVSQGYPPRGRFGTEFYTKGLVDGLRGRGHELSVLHPERSGSRPRYTLEEVEEEGLRIFLLHNPGDPKKRFEESYRDARVEKCFDELLERLQPDVVHFTYLLWGLSVRLPEVAKERGIPSVVTLTDYGLLCHRGQMVDWRLQRCFGPHPPDVCARCIREPAPYDHPPSRLALQRVLVRGLALLGGLGKVVMPQDLARRESTIKETFAAVSAFVAPTHVLAAAFRGAGIPANKISELVYAFDEAPYLAVASGPPPATPRFGFLGQFAPHKGLDTLLLAAEILDRRHQVRDQAWEVVLHGGGSGGRHRMFAPQVLAGRTGGRIRIGAPFGPEEAPRVLAGLSAIVLPSEWDENAPLSILQARAVGVPVLASDVPGIAEVVDSPAVGRLFPPGDAAALAERMEDVLAGRVVRNPSPALPLSLPHHLDKIEALYGHIRSG
jgi:glycosyltransferase involved in cell wall biosynthesis